MGVPDHCNQARVPLRRARHARGVRPPHDRVGILGTIDAARRRRRLSGDCGFGRDRGRGLRRRTGRRASSGSRGVAEHHPADALRRARACARGPSCRERLRRLRTGSGLRGHGPRDRLRTAARRLVRTGAHRAAARARCPMPSVRACCGRGWTPTPWRASTRRWLDSRFARSPRTATLPAPARGSPSARFSGQSLSSCC